ncbi:MAG: hypothetical protein AVDCRST_MAG14-1526, partial [uncultured Rubrobacteraceae bacterium]
CTSTAPSRSRHSPSPLPSELYPRKRARPSIGIIHIQRST